MCTSFAIFDKKKLFARNMDLDNKLDEEVIFIPKEYEIKFRYEGKRKSKYAVLGLGKKMNNYNFFFDAINECGLGISSLAFKDNCKYFKYNNKKKNITPYEFILYLLFDCKNIEEVKIKLKNINIIDEDFNEEIKNTPLHFFICDKSKSIVVESTDTGLNIYDNNLNVLTNNPSFPYHKENVKNYLYLNNGDQDNNLLKNQDIKAYSYNLGSFGLPGDYSSSSRFIKCLYVKNNLFLDGSYNDINECFKCLGSVSMINGCVKTENGFEKTIYSVCYDLDDFALYYKNYNCNNIEKFKEDTCFREVKNIQL